MQRSKGKNSNDISSSQTAGSMFPYFRTEVYKPRRASEASISNNNYNKISTLIITLIFVIIYQSIDWPTVFENINGYPMIDRIIYERSVLYYDLPTDYGLDFDIITYFSQEWLWNTSLAYLNRELGFSLESIFLVVTTVVLWRFSFEIASRAGALYVVFLINPLIVDFAFSQLRLAFAMAILSLFWTGKFGRILTVSAYVLCTSIHTVTVIFAVMHFSANRFSVPRFINLLIINLTGALIAAMTGPLRETVLGAIGDRREAYDNMSSTVLYLSFWIVMWFFLLYRWKSTMSHIDGRYALIVLSLVALNVVTGGYSTRFIAAAFPSLVIAMSRWQPRSLNLLLLLFVPYAGFQWAYWLKLM